MSDAQIFIFPLSNRYIRAGSITEFLKSLARTLKEGGTEPIGIDELRSKWRWIVKYLQLKPNFFGVGIDLNIVLDELFPA